MDGRGRWRARCPESTALHEAVRSGFEVVAEEAGEEVTLPRWVRLEVERYLGGNAGLFVLSSRRSENAGLFFLSSRYSLPGVDPSTLAAVLRLCAPCFTNPQKAMGPRMSNKSGTVRNVLAVAVAGVLLACSEPPCERAQRSTARLKELSQECAVTPVEFDLEHCEQQISECTATELNALEAVYECRDGIDHCVAGEESDWTAEVLGCAGPFNEVSDNCRGAFAGSL